MLYNKSAFNSHSTIESIETPATYQVVGIIISNHDYRFLYKE